MHCLSRLVPLLLVTAALAEDFPPPKSLIPPEQAGLALQRTMHLLADSTPEKHNTVRILYYGQSITEQHWTNQVTAWLRATYPNANLIIENRSIGGHSSERLVKTAEADLYPFQPDLLIFHVYGAHDKYEDIIRTVREKTCAEILIQTDHLSADQKIDEPVDIASLTPKQWAQWFNYIFLPSLRDKYQAEVIPQRDLWKQYLRDYELLPQDLLKDSVHLNPRGEYVMAEIVKSALRAHPEITDPPAAHRVVTTPISTRAFVPGPDADVTVTIPFEGNRIDAVMSTAGAPTTFDVLIDGKKPSEFPTTFAFSKSTGYNRSSWPCLLRETPGPTLLLAEAWTVTLIDPDADYSHFRFSLSGSVTGPDGEGDSGEVFTSKSGRIVIEPGDWNMAASFKVFKVPHPADLPIRFEAKPLHVDSFEAKPAASSAIETTLTLAQNLPPGPHTVSLKARLRSGEPTPLAAVRSYNPQAK